MSEALRTLILTAVASGAVLGWLSIRTARTDPTSPRRLVAELRLAQLAAVTLVFVAGAYLGFAAGAEHQAGTGLDVALALGFFVVGALAPSRDPREALTVLGLAFAGHAVVDVLHRPGALPVGVVPDWYLIGCAVFNVVVGGLCYLPMFKR